MLVAALVSAVVALLVGYVHLTGSLTRLTRQNRLLLDSAGEGILGLDLAGRIMFANPAAARLTGYRTEELAGLHLHDLFHPTRPGRPAHDAGACPLLAARDGNVHRISNDELARRDGTRLPADCTSSPIRENGEIIGLGLMFADVSQRLELEEQFRQSQKMEAVGRLAAGVAHDFNNLITVISGFANILKDRLRGQQPLSDDVEEILKAGNQAATLTRQLLVFSREEPRCPQMISVNDTVDQMRRMLERLLGASVPLDCALARDLAPVMADPGQIEQVLVNLVVNARDAMPAGGRLTIETGDVDGRVMLAVTDTGIGMDDATRARIFEPFFTTKERGRGSGLGLSIVYGVVKQSGGEIYVHSSPGRGATFKIYLPRAVGEVTAATSTPPLIASSGETVLLVEDDPSTRKVIRRVLEQTGYGVMEAHSVEEALDLVRERADPVHVLVTDLVLPGRSGAELASELAPRLPEMKVLFISGYTDRGVLDHVELTPGAAYLQKPFTPQTLARALRNLLEAPKRGEHALVEASAMCYPPAPSCSPSSV
jgi:two-component system cell cycle sensor histidine kinase/response regulator CckA